MSNSQLHQFNQVLNNEFQDELSTEDCVLAALYNLPFTPKPNPMGSWYDMTEEEQWEYLWYSNLAYSVR